MDDTLSAIRAFYDRRIANRPAWMTAVEAEINAALELLNDQVLYGRVIAGPDLAHDDSQFVDWLRRQMREPAW